MGGTAAAPLVVADLMVLQQHRHLEISLFHRNRRRWVQNGDGHGMIATMLEALVYKYLVDLSTRRQTLE